MLYSTAALICSALLARYCHHVTGADVCTLSLTHSSVSGSTTLAAPEDGVHPRWWCQAVDRYFERWNVQWVERMAMLPTRLARAFCKNGHRQEHVLMKYSAGSTTPSLLRRAAYSTLKLDLLRCLFGRCANRGDRSNAVWRNSDCSQRATVGQLGRHAARLVA